MRPAVQCQGLQAEQHEPAEMLGFARCHPAEYCDRLHSTHLFDAEILALGVVVRVLLLDGLNSEQVVEVCPNVEQPAGVCIRQPPVSLVMLQLAAVESLTSHLVKEGYTHLHRPSADGVSAASSLPMPLPPCEPLPEAQLLEVLAVLSAEEEATGEAAIRQQEGPLLSLCLCYAVRNPVPCAKQIGMLLCV